MKKSHEYKFKNKSNEFPDSIENIIEIIKDIFHALFNNREPVLIERNYDRKDKLGNLDNLNNSMCATRASKEYASEIEVLTNRDKVKLNSPVHIVNGRLGMR